ncbi:MAG TPA: 4'-phosphopantetheinyl transferase superfamily protein [Acidimicrobiales bacterium]|nr:4'-phosphopantetheinyl transferase superfamily protein [Acidimicrobiales bacterium]
MLQSPVVWCETTGDPPEAALFPPEERLVARAVDKRRRELTTGRHCARQALVQLGIAPGPILSGPAGEPLWPAGIVGSITHCAGFRAAAVARSTDVATVGIDAEPHEPLPEGVLEVVALSAERIRLDRLARHDGAVHWDRVLFCAKEAVYKAWYPHAQRMLDFDEAHIALHPGADNAADNAADDATAGTLHAELLVDGPTVDGRQLHGLAGRWAICDGLVVAAVTELRFDADRPDRPTSADRC